MFRDFLWDRADIYPVKRNTANRMVKDQTANAAEPVRRGAACRIHGDKLFFEPDTVLCSGDVVEMKDGLRYEVLEEKQTRSLREPHHRTYLVKRRRVGKHDAETER